MPIVQRAFVLMAGAEICAMNVQAFPVSTVAPMMIAQNASVTEPGLDRIVQSARWFVLWAAIFRIAEAVTAGIVIGAVTIVQYASSPASTE